jgi:glutathione peroxidase-family protein
MSAFHQLSATAITGQSVPMSDYEGTMALVVNVASR